MPGRSTFLPPVAVDSHTADRLGRIARIEDTTVATIIRQALADYADDYLLGYLDTLDGPVTDDFGPWLD